MADRIDPFPAMNPELQLFIKYVIVPALVDRFLIEQDLVRERQSGEKIKDRSISSRGSGSIGRESLEACIASPKAVHISQKASRKGGAR